MREREMQLVSFGDGNTNELAAESQVRTMMPQGAALAQARDLEASTR